MKWIIKENIWIHKWHLETIQCNYLRTEQFCFYCKKFSLIINLIHDEDTKNMKFIQIIIALSLDNNKLNNKTLTMRIFLMIHDFTPWLVIKEYSNKNTKHICENANPPMPEFFHLELHNKSNFTFFKCFLIFESN